MSSDWVSEASVPALSSVLWPWLESVKTADAEKSDGSSRASPDSKARAISSGVTAER